MSDNLIERPVIPLPDGFTWGFVTARSIHAMADTTQDLDRYPEARGSNGRVIFTPRVRFNKHTEDPTAFVQYEIARARIREGTLIDAEGLEGIWLITGDYDVTFQIDDGSIPGFPITVTDEYTKENPLDLVKYSPIETPPGYVEIVRIVDRERAEAAAEAAEGHAEAAEGHAEAAEGYAQDARQFSQAETFEGYISAAEEARDSAQGYAQDSEQAAESIGDVEEGFREVKRMAERPLTKFEWAGEPHDSESVKLINGVEVARNLCLNPSFEESLTRWTTAAASATTLSTFQTNMWNGRRSGSMIAQLSASGTNAYATLASTFSARMAVSPGQWVGVAMLVASDTRENGGVRADIPWRDSSGNIFRYTRSGDFEPADWYEGRHIVFAAQVPAGGAQMDVRTQMFSGDNDVNLPAGDRLWVDSVIVVSADTEAEALAQVEEYFDGDTVLNNLATESYVDSSLPGLATSAADGLMSSSDKAKLDESTNLATPSTLVRRNPNGIISVSPPTHSNHAANRGYVDTAISNVAQIEGPEGPQPEGSAANPISLGSTRLNDIQEPGIYYQNVQSDALEANDYPSTFPGSLKVFSLGQDALYQEYMNRGENMRMFRRYYSGAVWHDWVEL